MKTSQYLTQWFATAKSELQSTTAYGYGNNINKHIIPYRAKHLSLNSMFCKLSGYTGNYERE